MGSPRKFSSKIKTPIQLARLTGTLLRSRKKAVFTNGCFDLIHKGHVTYLERARKLGDVLIVALNSDSSVRKLKGNGRPLNSLADRMDVMAALESVDYVTWFDENTPLNLIKKIRPKVLVKGGDWRPDQIVGADDVISWGGSVHSLPYVAGKSTTRLLEKARKQ